MEFRVQVFKCQKNRLRSANTCTHSLKSNMVVDIFPLRITNIQNVKQTQKLYRKQIDLMFFLRSTYIPTVNAKRRIEREREKIRSRNRLKSIHKYENICAQCAQDAEIRNEKQSVCGKSEERKGRREQGRIQMNA